MFKNIASQKIALFAFDTTTGTPKTGDGANITPYVSKDYGSVTVLGTTTATEMDSTNAKGWYSFVMTQGETNGDALLFTAKSSTSNISLVGRLVFTDPPNANLLSVDSNGRVDVIKVNGTSQTAKDLGASATQTGDNYARLGAPAGASIAADVAAVKTDTAAVKTQTDKLAFTVTNQVDANVLDWKSATAPAMTGDAYARLGAPAGASVSADVAAVKAVLPSALTGGGNIKADAIAIGGTSQTGRDIGASVLLSSGTGTGQLDFTSGVVKTNLAQILGTALTETSGQIAAGFKKFFNIASPAATMDHGVLVDTVTTATTATNLTNAPTSGDFTSTMKTSLSAATPAVTVSDKTGFSLSSGGVQAIWDALTSALTTVGSIGKLLVTDIDATVSSRLAGASYTAPDNSDIAAIKAKTDNLPASPAAVSDIPTAVDNADAVWDETLADHLTSGTTGNALNAAGAAGDPWSTALPGSYGDGTAGKIVGTNIDATISSRLASGSYTAPDNTSITAIKTQTDKLAFTVTNQIDANVLDWKSSAAPAMTGDAYARLGAPAGASVSADVAAVKTDTAAVKTKTDSLTFTVPNKVDANVKSVNDVTVTGVGTAGSPWGP